MRLGSLKVALLSNAAIATLMSDFNAWTAGTGTGGTSASGLPTVREQQIVKVDFGYDGSEYAIACFYME